MDVYDIFINTGVIIFAICALCIIIFTGIMVAFGINSTTIDFSAKTITLHYSKSYSKTI